MFCNIKGINIHTIVANKFIYKLNHFLNDAFTNSVTFFFTLLSLLLKHIFKYDMVSPSFDQLT